jgi:hypothetical protein
MLLALTFFTGMFLADNSDFINIAIQQKSEGYNWVNVGKSTPSGTPAIVVKPENGKPFIIYRLEK